MGNFMSEKIRILKRLKQEYPDFSQKQIKKWLEEGRVLVGRRVAKLHDWVAPDESVSVSAVALQHQLEPNSCVECRILKQTRDYLFIFKPAGVDSVALHFDEKKAVANWLLAVAPECAVASPSPLEAGLVHRLDQETSGVMCAARSREAWEHARREFAAGRVEKEYECLVSGDPPQPGVYEAMAAPHPRSSRRVLIQEMPPGFYDARHDAKDASKSGNAQFSKISGFEDDAVHDALRGMRCIHTEILTVVPEGAWHRLRVKIVTGYRHQIRAHLAFLGCPIVGDAVYGRVAAPAGSYSGLQLWAVRLGFADSQGELIYGVLTT